MTMKLEILSGNDEVKEVRGKNMEIVALTQECYFHLPGSAYPQRGKVRVEKRQAPGTYQFDPEFRIGRFGDLEINPFAAPKLTPVSSERPVKSA